MKNNDNLKVKILSFAFFFLIFCAYAILKPIRDAVGTIGSLQHLPWLFNATFIVLVFILPLLNFLTSKIKLRSYITYVYGFLIMNLIVFAICFYFFPQNVFVARTFYIWVSVSNIIVISCGWSLMSDVFCFQDAKKSFGFIAGGASLGGMIGPLMTNLLATKFSLSEFAICSLIFLSLSIFCKNCIFALKQKSMQKFGDNSLSLDFFGGIKLIVKSRYLLLFCLFVFFITYVNTFLYFEQAKIVKEYFSNNLSERIKYFSTMDLIIQFSSLVMQVFLVKKITQKFGLTFLICLVPLMMIFAFMTLHYISTLYILSSVILLRRIGEYVFVKPGREMLFSLLSQEEKYKSKVFIDTIIYRGGDALSAWFYTLFSHWSMLMGAIGALMWLFFGFLISKRAKKI